MAKGSHATLGGWEPKTCAICGERVTLSGKQARGAVFSVGLERGYPLAWHPDCKNPLPAPRMLEAE